MSFLVENGSGVWAANAYVGIGYVNRYLLSLGKNAAWDALTATVQKQKIIAATNYVENRFGGRFRGYKKFNSLIVNAFNFLNVVGLPTVTTTFTLEDVVYTFRTSPTTANQIAIGATVAEATANIIAAINLTGTPDTEYGTGTLINPYVSASLIENDSILLESKLVGVLGNVTAAASTNNQTAISFDYNDLYDGNDCIEQRLEWPRLNARSNSGQEMIGIPDKLRQATSQLALRAITGDLMRDPTVDLSGRQVIETYDKVGPIETKRVFVGGSQQSIFQKFPEVDRLMSELVAGGQGGVSR